MARLQGGRRALWQHPTAPAGAVKREVAIAAPAGGWDNTPVGAGSSRRGSGRDSPEPVPGGLLADRRPRPDRGAVASSGSALDALGADVRDRPVNRLGSARAV